ncbi:hypothetical protein [Saccharothrix yanglingensis]|uniref:hypothetical protein n=1 Tax=Saccharothrix yanglingensis TaxID=659496 RepID=UPI0027D33786|nr:hypothetical protein [Saccharothrix yanglingensis]
MSSPPKAALVVACAAVLTTVASVAVAWSLRPPDQPDAGAAPAQDQLRCGTTACRSLVKREVGADSVELLVGSGEGRIRTNGASGPNIFELTVAASGADITEGSLQCADAEVTVCLVRGAAGGEVRGEVIVRRSGAWTRAQVPYLSSGAHLALADVDRDAVADVVAVQRACPGVDDCGRRFAQVFSVVGGGEVGCTVVVGSPEELPGWPEVVPDASTLVRCRP